MELQKSAWNVLNDRTENIKHGSATNGITLTSQERQLTNLMQTKMTERKTANNSTYPQTGVSCFLGHDPSTEG